MTLEMEKYGQLEWLSDSFGKEKSNGTVQSLGKGN